MDREKLIRDIAAAMAALEKCTVQEVENTKKLLRWMPDDALQDMHSKHMEALKKIMPAPTK